MRVAQRLKWELEGASVKAWHILTTHMCVALRLHAKLLHYVRPSTGAPFVEWVREACHTAVAVAGGGRHDTRSAINPGIRAVQLGYGTVRGHDSGHACRAVAWSLHQRHC